MANLSVDEVRNGSDFRLLKELKFSEILMFVFENIRVTNSYTVFYVLSNLLFLSLLVGVSIFGFMEGLFNFKTYMANLGWGILAGSILIIPFHEGLHALTFLSIGARKIKFGADFKQMIFYATAENFVAGRKGFSIVALAPYAIINLVSIPFGITGGIEMHLFLLSSLLLHNIMCIGDFAMLSFFKRNHDKELYTFDDLKTKTAWFYERIKA